MDVKVYDVTLDRCATGWIRTSHTIHIVMTVELLNGYESIRCKVERFNDDDMNEPILEFSAEFVAPTDNRMEAILEHVNRVFSARPHFLVNLYNRLRDSF